MRLVTTLFVLALIMPSVSAQDPGAVRNGFWWNEMPAEGRLPFVMGYIEGMSYADSMVTLAGPPIPTITRTMGPSKTEPVNEYFKFYQISFGQLVDGLTSFYADYRNKRIGFNTATMYIRDQIQGVPQKLLDLRLDAMRSAASKPDYDKYNN